MGSAHATGNKSRNGQNSAQGGGIDPGCGKTDDAPGLAMSAAQNRAISPITPIRIR